MILTLMTCMKLLQVNEGTACRIVQHAEHIQLDSVQDSLTPTLKIPI